MFMIRVVYVYVCAGPDTGGDTPNFFRGPTALGGPIGAHIGDFFFFFDERKNDNFWPGMMLIKLNLQTFSLFQEPLQVLLRPI